jgi:sterol desaturase/sphingolipid hydroxylase (fatty acid hydroxylase superfamily)
MQHAEPALYAVPAFALLMLVERLGDPRDPEHPASGLARRDTAGNRMTSVLGLLIMPVTQYLLPFSAIVLAAALTPLHVSPRHWWVWVAGLVVTDLCYYWAHRADHRIRVLWAAHSAHHSSTYLTVSTAIRLPCFNPAAATLRSLAWVPAALLGFPAWMIFLLIGIGLLYQFPMHTQHAGTLWQTVEFVFNTPSHHRVHHGCDQPYPDRNYGGVFIVWDRLFGSFATETEPLRTA